MSATDVPSRIVVHVDLDCFYCQVEQKRLSIPRDQPCAVQQWCAFLWHSSEQLLCHQFVQRDLSSLACNRSTACFRDGLIAVNYAARKLGISKLSNLSEALQICPHLRLVHVEVLGASLHHQQAV